MESKERGNGGQLKHRKAKGPLLVCGPRAQPRYSWLSPPWLEEGHGEETGSKSQQQEQQPLFPSPINRLHHRGGERVERD